MGRGSRGQLVRLVALLYVATLAVNRSLVRVTGPSMEPSLVPGDRLLTVPALRWWLRPGQVVVVRDPARPGHLAVKRLASMGTDGARVLGDAPDRSTDSRAWGPLPYASIRRVAIARWPDLRTPLSRTSDAASTG